MDGSGVRGLRLKLGLTQVQFAKRLGVSASLIGDVESGRRNVSANLRVRIALECGAGEDVIETLARAKASSKLVF
ncbi:helix-turn-helix domain-containing protein [Paenibacillus humicus]|uniref:helix-turn-helix domain-containing protein n=1 Tax=Paenibacillus humicus TaxID=412861 RepID=UPI000FDAE846|nr:helix-turn-helix transcriptional regulator [Paenibacillus humicus]